MRIGISFNGEGRGHLTRISAIARKLQNRHELIFWAPKTRYMELEKLFPTAVISQIPAFELSYTNNNQVDIVKTGSNNLANLLELSSISRDIRNQIEFFKPDILVSDFEPIVPSASKGMNMPVIQFNHPAVVLRDKTPDYDAFIARIIAKKMCSVYDEIIISSFYSGDVGPIIRKEIQEAERKNGNFILVYLRGKSQRKIFDVLNLYSSIPYRVFPESKNDFVTSLASCSAVITNAGHQLLSEAAYLEKPLFMIPIERQYEQLLNARMMEKSERGVMANKYNLEKKLMDFLKSLPKHKTRHLKSNTKFIFNDNTKEAVDLLELKFASLKTKKAS